MSDRRSASERARHKARHETTGSANGSVGVRAARPVTGPIYRRPWFWPGLIVACIVSAAAAFVLHAGWSSAKDQKAAQDALELCERFVVFKNAGNPKARDLLVQEQTRPDGPITPAEADAIDADALLRSDLTITDVLAAARGDRKAGEPPRCILVLEGRFYPDVLPLVGVPTPPQRSLVNPEVLVEVVDGRIRGILARVH